MQSASLVTAVPVAASVPPVTRDALARAPLPVLDALALLDDPAQWSAFSQPCADKPGWVESSVVIEGMTCTACALAVEAAMRQVPGVVRAEVGAASRRATVIWAIAATRPSQWMQAARRAGYGVVPANDRLARLQQQHLARKALWRWLVAGLCMMQVMMYAYPAYVALPGDLGPDLVQLLRWASWVLTLPVLLFSCGPFFRSALRDAAQRRVGMDLPVALGILITFMVSTAGTFDPYGRFGREVYFDSLTMFVFFLLTGRWLELRLRERTAGALEALLNRLPQRVLRQAASGGFEPVAARQLAPGDVLRVLPGEAFAADGVLHAGQTEVDEALLSGESRPIAKWPGDPVVAGSFNLSASVDVQVNRVGADTRFAHIAALMHSAATSKPRLAVLADRLAKPFLLVVLLAAAAACAYWWPSDPGRALMVAVAVLIVTCPCALSLATPASMLAAAGSLARQGVLVRRLQALEALAQADTVVFDKTGTLTTDTLELAGIHMRVGTDAAEVTAMAGALAAHSLHPVSRTIVRAAAGSAAWSVVNPREEAGQGVRADLVLAGSADAPTRLRLGSAAFCEVPALDSDHTEVFLSDGRGWLATFTLRQQIRPGAKELVTLFEKAGLQLHMLSGDQPGPAQAVARALGIQSVQARCSPRGKLEFVQSLQAAGRKVVVLGDGINDAPILAAADVAFALGQAAPLAQSHADFVLPGAQLCLVAQTWLLAARTMRVVRQNLGWALVYNLACIPLAVAGWLPAWLAGLGMACSSLVVVLNALRLALPGSSAQGTP